MLLPQISDALCWSLGFRCLLLRDTGLTENGAQLVCKASNVFEALETLDLSGNEMTEASIEVLGESLGYHKQLEKLMLDDNELESDGVKALASVLQDAAVVPELQGTSHRCLRPLLLLHMHLLPMMDHTW